MRRIVLVVALVAIVGLAAYMLLKPKPPQRSSSRRATAGDTSGAAASVAPRQPGRTAGRLRAKTKEERAAERKRLREERRRQQREARRRERERRRALRSASRRGRSSFRRARKGQYYVLKATIVAPGSERFALIDSRRVGIGDVVMGRRVVAIDENSIQVEAFGRVTTVRIGESLLPPGAFTTRRRSRG